MEFVDEIYQTAREVRDEILQKAFRQAQENGWHDMDASILLQGRCIEASDTLVEQLREKGYDCEARQCWCLYENYESCTSKGVTSSPACRGGGFPSPTGLVLVR